MAGTANSGMATARKQITFVHGNFFLVHTTERTVSRTCENALYTAYMLFLNILLMTMEIYHTHISPCPLPLL